MDRQAGFTLVEILVALTLSLLLIIGVTEIFMGNRDTYRVQSGMGTLQETARFATETLRREINLAGYFPLDLSDPQYPFDATRTLDAPATAPDTISVRYLSDRSCAGVIQTPVVELHTWSVFRDPISGISSLACNGIPIIDGVENMQFLYGYDTDGEDRVPNQFVKADSLSGSQWQHVVAVRFALLIDSGQPVSREPDRTSFFLLDAPELKPPSDLLRRRIYFGTAIVRNVATNS